VTLTWMTKPSWGLSHALLPDSVHEFRGVEYVRTLCGRTVRVGLLVPERLFGDQCRRCVAKEAAS
jgi:hypothetical protein